jgi:hypothetical protein
MKPLRSVLSVAVMFIAASVFAQPQTHEMPKTDTEKSDAQKSFDQL